MWQKNYIKGIERPSTNVADYFMQSVSLQMFEETPEHAS